MATKAKNTPPVMFNWSAKTIPEELVSPLKVLAGRYPALSTKKGGIKLEFKKGGKASECSVKQTKDRITITYNKANMALRMVGAVLSGNIPEKPDYCPFEMFGVMIDCSRDAVMTVDYMKTYLDRLAILGYNMVMLYTEETYKIEGEPFFGAMRSAYTLEEIKEIDQYAAGLGIEMIPCIQTLGHLDQMFRWEHYSDVRDIHGILLVDEPKTYELIEKMLITWKGIVRSRRIHLGMDEAHGVGTGKFKDLHGKESPFNIINRHLKKVVELCKKHGFEPMMWSDMYFRCGSKKNDYYDKECVIPKDVIKGIPKEVELVYWDYYHEDKAFYTDWIARHRAMKKEPIMASGIWTWSKFWYEHYYTRMTVPPCIEACREAKLKDVVFTMWGDDGGYCDYDSAFAGLAFAAEYAFTGKADETVLEERMHGLFNGASYSDILQLANCCYANFPPMLWDDPLMLIYIGGFIAEKENARTYELQYNYKTVVAELQSASKKLVKAKKTGDAGNITYAKIFTDMMLTKLVYAGALIEAYEKKNRKKAVQAVIPMLEAYRKNLKKFIAEFRTMWFSHNKPCGFESIQIRLAGQLVRTDEAILRLNEFVAGKTKNIPELDDLLQIRDQLHMRWASWKQTALGTIIF